MRRTTIISSDLVLTKMPRYLIKMHQLLGGASEQYPRMYAAAIDAAEQRLIRPITVVPGLEGAVTFADLHFREQHSGQLKSWLAVS